MKYLAAFAVGIGASAIVFTGFWMGQFGLVSVCEPNQNWQNCTQLWLAAIGPTVALIFAGIGAQGLARQVDQGQHAVAATRREQLRHEYQILTETRNGLLAKQKHLEKDFEEPYTDRSRLAVDAAWEEFEAFQYKLDWFVEWIDDVRRDPYLYDSRERLKKDRKPIAARAEVFRSVARRFVDGEVSRDRMAKFLHVSILITIRDMENQREHLDNAILDLGGKLASSVRRQ